MSLLRDNDPREVKRLQGDGGVALIEFALVIPLMATVLFAIIDFGWVFAQFLDTRHGTSEGARLVAVNYNPNEEESGSDQRADLVAAVCESMDIASGSAVELDYAPTVVSGGARPSAGDFVTITVDTPAEQLTGYFGWILDGLQLDYAVETRLEVDATWDEGTGTC